MTETMLRANDVNLCVETFGNPADPAILLIHGATASMLAWEDEFCTRLARAGRFVIRFDHRDTGRSVSYPTGRPPYSLADMTDDALAILDVLHVERAHLVGRSMGGAMAMRAALDHPERVTSLTLMATTPGGDGLPPPSASFTAHVEKGPPAEWTDREFVTDYIVATLRAFDGGSPGYDARAVRRLVIRDMERTVNIASSQINHFAIAQGESLRERLPDIAVPTLVIHGANDPVFPLEHACTLAREIPGAELLVLPHTGHLILEAGWRAVVPAIVRVSAAGRST